MCAIADVIFAALYLLIAILALILAIAIVTEDSRNRDSHRRDPDQVSRAKDKGTRAETAVTRFLKRVLGEAVYRMTLHGSRDLGDIGGVYVRGKAVAVEVKDHKRYEIPQWLTEAEREAGNSDAPYFIVVVKPNGVGQSRPQDFWVITTLSQWVEQTQGVTATNVDMEV